MEKSIFLGFLVISLSILPLYRVNSIDEQYSRSFNWNARTIISGEEDLALSPLYSYPVSYRDVWPQELEVRIKVQNLGPGDTAFTLIVDIIVPKGPSYQYKVSYGLLEEGFDDYVGFYYFFSEDHFIIDPTGIPHFEKNGTRIVNAIYIFEGEEFNVQISVRKQEPNAFLNIESGDLKLMVNNMGEPVPEFSEYVVPLTLSIVLTYFFIRKFNQNKTSLFNSR